MNADFDASVRAPARMSASDQRRSRLVDRPAVDPRRTCDRRRARRRRRARLAADSPSMPDWTKKSSRSSATRATGRCDAVETGRDACARPTRRQPLHLSRRRFSAQDRQRSWTSGDLYQTQPGLRQRRMVSVSGTPESPWRRGPTRPAAEPDLGRGLRSVEPPQVSPLRDAPGRPSTKVCRDQMVAVAWRDLSPGRTPHGSRWSVPLLGLPAARRSVVRARSQGRSRCCRN